MLNLDSRRFSDVEDKIGACRKCGYTLVMLPDDRRQGYCFDCFEVLEV